MMTTPNDDLAEQIEKALWGSIRVYDWPSGRGVDVFVHDHVHEVVAAVLPIVEDAVKRGQAEAWNQGAETAWSVSTIEVNDQLYHWRKSGEPRNPYREETPDEQ